MSRKKEISCLSPNWYIVGYDTQKRKKYTTEQEERMVSLKFSGMSIRNIAKEMGIPFGSIHYILKKYGCTNPDQSKPGLNWLDRKECEYQFDMNGKSFDYVKNSYPQYYKNKNGKVFIHVDYLYEYYVGNKGFHDRWKRES